MVISAPELMATSVITKALRSLIASKLPGQTLESPCLAIDTSSEHQ